MAQITAAEYASYTKDALASALAEANNTISRLSGRAARMYQENQETVDTVLDFAGSIVTGPVTALGVGFLETRYPNRDGTQMSLGPLPLPIVVGAISSVAAIFTPKIITNQLHYVTAANLGLFAGSLGRGMGATRRAKALKADQQPATEGIGFQAPIPIGAAVPQPQAMPMGGDEWTPEERALLEGNNFANAA